MIKFLMGFAFGMYAREIYIKTRPEKSASSNLLDRFGAAYEAAFETLKHGPANKKQG
jgi:hypothetical protein